MISSAYILNIMQSTEGLARFAFQLDPSGSWEKVNIRKARYIPPRSKNYPSHTCRTNDNNYRVWNGKGRVGHSGGPRIGLNYREI